MMMKASVRSMAEIARENSEKIHFTATQQQRLSVILHELSGTVSTDQKNGGVSTSSSGTFSGSKNTGGFGDSSSLSRPILHPLEGTYVLTIDFF